MTILLVDSDKGALERETERLTGRQLAISVSLHSNAKDAIRFAAYHDIDVVFTRAFLADMTGRELVERIRRFRPEAECYILQPGEEIPFGRFSGLSRDAGCFGNTAGNVPNKENEAKKGVHIDRIEDGQPGTSEYFHQKKRKKGDEHTTEHELRSLNRKELLEIMIEQGRELEECKLQYEKDLEFLKSEHEKDRAFLKSEYEKELASLKEELNEAKRTLNKREIDIDEAGSIAVAALQINGVFEAAQAASQQYIENIRSLSERQESICAKRDAKSRAEAERRIRETEIKCENMEVACKRRCKAIEAKAKEKSEAYWEEVSHRLQSFYDNHKELKKLLDFKMPNIKV